MIVGPGGGSSMISAWGSAPDGNRAPYQASPAYAATVRTAAIHGEAAPNAVLTQPMP